MGCHILIKIKGYHKDNKRCAEQPFRSSIENSNQTINVFGIGSHHKNATVKRKPQTLTLGTVTLFPHAKICFPEAITTMSRTYEVKAFA